MTYDKVHLFYQAPRQHASAEVTTVAGTTLFTISERRDGDDRVRLHIASHVPGVRVDGVTVDWLADERATYFEARDRCRRAFEVWLFEHLRMATQVEFV